jgi:hypothetical protein
MAEPTLTEVLTALAALPDLVRNLSTKLELLDERLSNQPKKRESDTIPPAAKQSEANPPNIFKTKGISQEKWEKYAPLVLQGLLNSPIYDKCGVGREAIRAMMGQNVTSDLVGRVVKRLVEIRLLEHLPRNRVGIPKSKKVEAQTFIDNSTKVNNGTALQNTRVVDGGAA